MIKRVLNLYGFLDNDLVSGFLNHVNELNADPAGNELKVHYTIYLTSPGGFLESQQLIEDVINSEPGKFTLIANGEISSSAFALFMNAKCHKTILPGTFGMFHLTRRGIEVGDGGKGYYCSDKFHIENFTFTKKEAIDWCEKLGMNHQEIEHIMTNSEQYFTRERIIEFLDNQRRELNDKQENIHRGSNTEAAFSNGEGHNIVEVV